MSAAFDRHSKLRPMIPHPKEHGSSVIAHLPSSHSPSLVEVGVHLAEHAYYLLASHPTLQYYGIDCWIKGGPRARKIANQRLAPFRPRASLHDLASPGAANLFKPSSMDLVYIDAKHTYAAVLADIRAWWPIVRPGGWLSGHDYGWDPNPNPRAFQVDEAVDFWVSEQELPLETGRGYTWFVRKPRDE